MTSAFFGYPGHPERVAEVLRSTAKRVATESTVETWEDLDVGGRVVIREVLASIDRADFSLFDVTHLNQNVLFEAGYAVARGKPIWLTLDVTDMSAKQRWSDLGLLRPIGYTAYKNSQDLAAKFAAAAFGTDIQPLYDTLIEPALPTDGFRTSLLYCPPYEPFEAANSLSSLVEDYRRRGLEVVAADPTESSLNPITWWAPKIGQAAGVLINFAGETRNRSDIQNARHAFVAGLAHGLETPLLMLAEDDYARPFDYEDLVRVYRTAASCVTTARKWLSALDIEAVGVGRHKPRAASRLTGLRFGEHVAENELAELDDYFVRTAAYADVLQARDTLFIGHRGTGKTANALQAFEEVSRNRENLAVLIKPAGFEFPGLIAAIDRLPEHTHDYLYDTLWRFLIQTEIASTLLGRIERRPTYVPLTEAEGRLRAYLDAAPFDVSADLSVRLDQALRHLIEIAEQPDVERGRILVNEAFHTEALAELRHLLGPPLKNMRRVAVFIDNLDKGWQRGAELKVLARLILGLLSARGQIVKDFSRQDWWRDQIKISVAVFLRSDIFAHVKSEAREPDKLSISAVAWKDPETLLRIIEDRFESTWRLPGKRPRLWGEVFCSEVQGTPTSSYMRSVVLPRPRDLVYLCNAAVAAAIDRQHEVVTEADLATAEEAYSQYAYEGLLVENGITIPQMQDVLLAFLGCRATLTRLEIGQLLSGVASLPAQKQDSVFNRLIEMSFLGLEVKPEEFHFPEVGSDLHRARRLAERLQPDTAKQRLRIHRAFHGFLVIG
jgi:hypothetical protein